MNNALATAKIAIDNDLKHLKQFTVAGKNYFLTGLIQEIASTYGLTDPDGLAQFAREVQDAYCAQALG
jgi:hypothetical protein